MPPRPPPPQPLPAPCPSPRLPGVVPASVTVALVTVASAAVGSVTVASAATAALVAVGASATAASVAAASGATGASWVVTTAGGEPSNRGDRLAPSLDRRGQPPGGRLTPPLDKMGSRLPVKSSRRSELRQVGVNFLVCGPTDLGAAPAAVRR